MDELRRVLLVEDNDAHAVLIQRIFEENGSAWSISRVSTLADALRFLDENRDSLPDIVIADYRLPDGTGLDLTRGAGTPEDVGFPLIILTGVGSEKLAVQTMKSGAMDYVVKSSDDLRHLPSTASRILQEWNTLMERRRTEMEIAKCVSDLEADKLNLDEFMDKISQELEEAIATIKETNSRIKKRFGNNIDDETLKDLYRIESAAEKAGMLTDKLFEYLLPLYFDSSLVRLYMRNLEELKRRKEYST
ncbi:MAG TPA: response regulator [Methanothrix sp.]|nr:response regulator [Methanothrix sp.]HOK58719.1 response regulator [Methanothrix sp.]HOL43891.1 response regulator [Methanothrix sp.]HPO88941.1 response regulator [Methanothrix sp.]